MPMIAIDDIDPPIESVRKRPPTREAEAQLEDSIRHRGVLQPILVRKAGNRYVTVAGSRRLAAARAVGLSHIPAAVSEYLATFDAADQAVENMVRAPLEPIDQWRAIVRLQDQGYTLQQAAQCLGLSDRRTRQLDKLGRLHPDVLAQLERHGMPDDPQETIYVIAMVPPEVQAKALRDVLKAGHQALDDEPDWWRVTTLCTTGRISREDAIFDADKAGIVFEEDLFAQPGDHYQFTTRDVAGFIAAQKAALEAEAKKAKKRLQIGKWDPRGNSVVLPAGWVRTHGDHEKPRKDEAIFAVVAESGYSPGRVARVLARKVAAKDAHADAPATADEADDDTDFADPEPTAPEPAPPRDPISRAGHAAIASAKTEALRQHIIATVRRGMLRTDELLTLLVLALGARTVRVSAEAHKYDATGMRDLALRLVPRDNVDGILPEPENIAEIAAEALARLLLITTADDERHDHVPEWIGQAIGADAALPRFDTPEFLAQVSTAELRRVAMEAGIKAPAKAGDLRARLAGNLPDWRPCRFGAPAPKADVRIEEEEDA
ncbi:ParB/RepB/Spo0J family partition protein [Limobrevibacterium gyesilva]|uniref:ParB/RepB/Spo0J family partition protein n=1 Tax=Limobrevibacterium gyesilva TaxID=2991712 RepID=A0AA42CK15_9PROT|nr:ParB/RepB/Spo0J family partition protein [Limobrevibacterium gyesilva]MCW3477395.1 ParB/RepB/Spo0J family partition protein [Limobrevibacterium gyesilva]